MTLLLEHSGWHHREGMQTMDTGQLVGGRGSQPHYGNPGEQEVTCKVENADGKVSMFNGVFVFEGAPALGVELDHEAQFLMEYGYPEGNITLIGFQGLIRKIDAWIATVDGPLVVLKAVFKNSLKVEEGDAIPVAGPELRYSL